MLLVITHSVVIVLELMVLYLSLLLVLSWTGIYCTVLYAHQLDSFRNLDPII